MAYLGEGSGLLGRSAMPSYASKSPLDTSFGGNRGRKRRKDDAGGVDESALAVMGGDAIVDDRGAGRPEGINVDPVKIRPNELTAAQPTSQAVNNIQTPTFSELRMSGRARPAPPTYTDTTGAAIQSAIAKTQAPSRFDSDLVRQTMSLFDQRLANQASDSQRQLDEQASARGLFDSNVALAESRRLQSDLGNQRAQFMTDLATRQADTVQGDQMAALQALFSGANMNRQNFESDRAFQNDSYDADQKLLMDQYGLSLDRDKLGITQTGQDRDQLLALLKLFGDPNMILNGSVG